MDVTSSSVPREPIYAGLGVPEIWRSNGRRVQCLHLVGQKYLSRKHSLAFPFLQPPDLQRFLAMCDVSGETAAVVEFVKWVRKQSWYLPA
jgi:hypothetical protein